MISPTDLALHLLTTLALPPLLPGVVQRVKAAFAGRTGPPLLQPYRDIAKLMRKGLVVSRTTTWVFFAGPAVGLAATLLASMLVPFGSPGAPISFAGDLVLFAYLFGLARFFTTAASLDTGSAFEGMGAARELLFATFAEPALFLGFLILVRITGALSLSSILTAAAWPAATAPLALLSMAWLLVFLAENCRVPFDDPATHLELTMVHEVMVLDHGGPAFGLILYGASIKLLATGALLVRVALPVGSVPAPFGWLLFVAGILALAVLVGVIESVIARLRLARVPQLLVTSSLLAAFGFVLLLR
jgi:formate hydrogenlyase subunit 4